MGTFGKLRASYEMFVEWLGPTARKPAVDLHALEFRLEKLAVPEASPEAARPNDTDGTSELNGLGNKDRDVHRVLCQRLVNLRRQQPSWWQRFWRLFKR